MNYRDNKQLMADARQVLSGRWKTAVGAAAIFLGISYPLQWLPPLGGFAAFIVSGPLTLGLTCFWLGVSRQKPVRASQVLSGFQVFWKSFSAYFLSGLFAVLWALLLIVPGIMAALSYAMTFYILADNDAMGARDAISASKEMMLGHRWRLTCLFARFIGWGLLSVLTAGIGFLWLLPYVGVSTALFYEDLKSRQNTIN
jgi:uncharacterized membrane protein